MASWLEPLDINFHNIIAARIHTDHPDVRGFFDSEYKYHLADALSEDLPTVKLSFQLRNQLGSLPPKYTSHSHKIVARWGYNLKINPDKVWIDVIGNRMAIPMVHHMLLHQSIRFLAAFQDVAMLHAGAIARDGYSLIFTGKGGVGKTTTTSLVLAQGGKEWSLHADDYVFLAPGPKSLAYLTRCHLYRNLLGWVPEVSERLTPSERIKLEVFGRIRTWSRDGIKWSVRLPVDRLWPNNAPMISAIPSAFVILERDDVEEPILSPIIEKEAPVHDLIEMNFSEAKHFLHLIQKNKAIQNYEAWHSTWVAQERKLLKSQLSNTPVYKLRLPSQATNQASTPEILHEQLSGLIPLKARLHAQPAP